MLFPTPFINLKQSMTSLMYLPPFVNLFSGFEYATNGDISIHSRLSAYTIIIENTIKIVKFYDFLRFFKKLAKNHNKVYIYSSYINRRSRGAN